MATTHALYTIGYANRSLDDFIALLKQHAITALCDVRSSPYSRRQPEYNRELLQKTLQASGIDYVFLGAELGARPQDQDCYVDGKAAHDRIAMTPLFQQGLERIALGMQRNYVVSLMCAEKDPMTCHRGILICRHLCGRDFSIRHIIDPSTVESQEELELRLVRHLRVQADMFTDISGHSVIERAYDMQGDRIAYVEKPTKDAHIVE